MTPTLDSLQLDKKFNVISLSIVSSSQIVNRASLVIDHLTKDHTSDGKPTICRINARAKVANKLISVVEISKRDLKAKGHKVYQYSSLASEIVTLKQKESNSVHKDAISSTQVGDEDGDESFQTMAEKEKVRALPVMTVILARQSIKELKTAYGEQV